MVVIFGFSMLHVSCAEGWILFTHAHLSAVGGTRIHSREVSSSGSDDVSCLCSGGRVVASVKCLVLVLVQMPVLLFVVPVLLLQCVTATCLP